ncbi:TPM domain-containing protein [Spirosoma sp. KCTC 42546]|uniref:TPM domain-containing protein n=1 Tax=Spirosoma sp. KCTC 42546 TaxID=2520506 RepID=UPI00115836B6|nr:TPM domain-containing protein [Spirosoma sp. KCTC 42546]QDK82765.1 TPM domain-containing protein [Spirosoma sp. KCTC 42546]
MNQSSIRLIVFLFLLIGGGITPAVAQTYTLETVPNPKQSQSSYYVSNPDHILSSATVRQIDQMLGKLEDSTTAQVAVVCLNSIGESIPKDFATALFRKWGLGYQQKNNGFLVLLVKDQHRIEMETGYGLEGILPDAICKRIQTEKMIPLAKTGDFDGAMLVGVQEIARLISEPEAAKEVYDKSKAKSYQKGKPLDDGAIIVFFFLLTPALLALRLLLFFFRNQNPIADKIEITISQSRRRLLWAFLLYVLMPVCVGCMVVQLRDDHWLHSWQILLVFYAYPGVVLWDARRRRINTFNQLFGTMTESERYVRYKAAQFNGLGNILLYPIPFWWMKKEDEKALYAIRNANRTSPEGYQLTKVPVTHRDAFLTDYQKTEQNLGTVDYDVWRNDTHDSTQTIGYENLNNTAYQRCKKCGSKAEYLVRNRVIKEATSEREGRGAHDYECKACGHHHETQYTIAIAQGSASRPSNSNSSTTYSSSGSSSGSSWGGSSSSSSSSSSWGGGSSGGGGAGSSW